jgi:hypothetical protein
MMADGQGLILLKNAICALDPVSLKLQTQHEEGVPA